VTNCVELFHDIKSEEILASVSGGGTSSSSSYYFYSYEQVSSTPGGTRTRTVQSGPDGSFITTK
jgi:hypothetical protein